MGSELLCKIIHSYEEDRVLFLLVIKKERISKKLNKYSKANENFSMEIYNPRFLVILILSIRKVINLCI